MYDEKGIITSGVSSEGTTTYVYGVL